MDDAARSELARDEVRLAEAPDAQEDVEALGHGVDEVIAQREVETDLGIALEEAWKRRYEERTPERDRRVDAEEARRLLGGARDRLLRLTQLGQDAHAALVEGL